MFQFVSLDLETLDVTSTAVVLSIGAAVFNITDDDVASDFTEDRCYYTQLQIQPQIDMNRTISGATVMWWLNQSKAAQAGISDVNQKRKVSTALSEFDIFVKSHDAEYLVGNGNMFDNAILRSLFADEGYKFPFKFWADLDLRTMRIMANDPTKPKRTGVHHNALHDAIYQAICAQKYYAVSQRESRNA